MGTLDIIRTFYGNPRYTTTRGNSEKALFGPPPWSHSTLITSSALISAIKIPTYCTNQLSSL